MLLLRGNRCDTHQDSGTAYSHADPGDGIDGWPQWAADGTRLLYTRQHDSQTDVRVVTLDGGSDDLLVTGLPDPTCHTDFPGAVASGKYSIRTLVALKA